MENTGLQIFANKEFGEIRTVMLDSEPWFAGKDVALALGYSNPQKAIRDHVDDEDRTVNEIFTVHGTRGTLINESGLYCLILSSKMPSAKRFKRWVVGEVLPALRKTGFYTIQGETLEAENSGLSFEDYMRAANITSKCAKEQLPMVTYLLEKAGFTFPDGIKPKMKKSAVKQIKEDPYSLPRADVSVEEAKDAIERLRALGYSFNEIESITDINRVLLSYYLNGQRKPTPGRCAYIVETIDNFLKENA